MIGFFLRKFQQKSFLSLSFPELEFPGKNPKKSGDRNFLSCVNIRPINICLQLKKFHTKSCISGIERVLTTFIKTTYDNSLDSQTSLLPLGFSLHALSAEQPAMKENEGNK